jgi:hypothetical protein
MDRISRKKGGMWCCCICLLALALLPGCGKQDEPASSPSESNAGTTPEAANKPSLDALMSGAPDAGSDLRILYAGHPGSEREADFVTFLREHFDAVETTDLAAFEESQCDGFDVTILDYDGNGYGAPRPSISQRFSRPLVTVGVAGGLMSSNWRLKTGYS